MKLKNIITVATMALAMAVGFGNLYAQRKVVKKAQAKEQQNRGESTDYGKPTDVKAEAGAFAVVPLKYDYNAVDKYIDTETMYIHFSKHYVGYINNLNKAVAGKPEAQKPIEELIRTLDINNAALRNNAGGYYNHTMYFDIISPKGGGQPTGKLAAAINRDFGSFEAFKKAFAEAGTKRFGSGWVWLVVKNGKFAVVSTANQDCPLMAGLEVSGTPILAMDVWEHAYYLKYQNKRGDYISNFFNVIDWENVGRRYGKMIN